jgi:predicted phage terminase large subunit-like protein
MSTSVGGTLTGRGADLIIIDDPLKPTDALSDARRRSTNDWFDNTLYTRLNDKRMGRIVLITQRVHIDDLVGHVLEQEPWEVVSLPVIAQRDEEHRIETPYGTRVVRRRAGDLLHPERESTEEIEGIRRSIGEYNFAGQYLQEPVPAGGGMVKEVWFKRYAAHQKPATFDRILQSWDTANKPTELSDFSVCTTWGLKGKDIYILHVLRKRLAYPDLKRAVREQYQAFGAGVVLIEDKASGTQLIQELTQEGLYAVTAYKPKDEKRMRMHAQTAMIENGFVYLPEADHWLPEYLHELTTFPFGKYDDQVDSTSQALDWIKQSGLEPYFLQYMKQQVDALTKSQTTIVRLRRPREETHVITMEGRLIAVEPDGTIELTEEDAGPLHQAGWTRIM